MTAPRIDSPLPISEPPQVREFRQILVWPLQLLPASNANGGRVSRAELHQRLCAGGWQAAVSAFAGDPQRFSERHYKEFVSFLPHAQRFLYGESRALPGANPDGEAALRAFRRHDIHSLRVVLREGMPALLLWQVSHFSIFCPATYLVILPSGPLP